MADYIDGMHRLPQHMRHGLKLWIENGFPAGGFMMALLSNDLMGAFGKADDANTAAMRDWCRYLYNDAPSGCYGSPAKVQAWMDSGGLIGQRIAKEA